MLVLAPPVGPSGWRAGGALAEVQEASRGPPAALQSPLQPAAPPGSGNIGRAPHRYSLIPTSRARVKDFLAHKSDLWGMNPICHVRAAPYPVLGALLRPAGLLSRDWAGLPGRSMRPRGAGAGPRPAG
jgi:hypothetical protein